MKYKLIVFLWAERAKWLNTRKEGRAFEEGEQNNVLVTVMAKYLVVLLTQSVNTPYNIPFIKVSGKMSIARGARALQIYFTELSESF